MTDNRLLDLVDAHDFRTLFIDELGWDNPDRPPVTLDVDGIDYTLAQVAGYKGLRIWHCPVLPPRPAQRQIDVLVGKDNLERLVIFTDDHRQEWRWPRRKQLGSTNAKLIVHQYHNGDRTTHLADRLQAIELDFDEDLPLVTLLDRMRDAFDREAETASVAAARLMGTLYTHLDSAGVGEHDATLLLARLLFLFFGDDADMWKPAALFENYLRNQTADETLHTDLVGLFEVLNTPTDRRTIAEGDPLSFFRYINGGLFEDPLRLPPLPAGFRSALLAASGFNWSVISPAVFGSMFQTVKSREARRRGGEHYTTEENILKTIRPLFLDEYRDRLERAWNDKGQLSKLHNDLAQLRFLDPACGCGNFLIVAYRELRALELDLLKRRRDLDMEQIAVGKKVERAQLSLDVTASIKVTLDHFFGIEIEEWPARIAETAMLLVDHLANQQMAEEFGEAPDRLPIAIAPTIVHDDALEVQWHAIVPRTDGPTFVFGNPPFLGHATRSEHQANQLRLAWGNTDISRLDFVTAWHAKALELLADRPGEFAFVTTSSITQGDQVPRLFGEIFDAKWTIKFAHRTFAWSSEASGAAAVHCVIIGFTRAHGGERQLWIYATPTSEPELVIAKTINAYLVDGPNVLVDKRMSPLSPVVTPAVFGNMARDGGNLIVEADEYDDVAADPVASKYLRPFRGSREMLYNRDRWCLWMTDLDPSDVERSPVLKQRLDAVRALRADSRAASTRAMAATPHLFGQRSQPSTDYLALPKVVSENREYFTVARYPSSVIASDLIFHAQDPDGLLFALASSAMFICWQKTVGGRLESRLRFANTLTWNTFPVPTVSTKQRRAIILAGQRIIACRDGIRPEKSLAELYDPDATPEELLDAHAQLDRAVDQAFGVLTDLTARERQQVLFGSYAALVAGT